LTRKTKKVTAKDDCEESILVLLNNAPLQFKRVLSLMETEHKDGDLKKSEHFQPTIFEESEEDDSSENNTGSSQSNDYFGINSNGSDGPPTKLSEFVKFRPTSVSPKYIPP